MMQRAFFSDEPDKLATVRELFDVSFSDARVSSLLHDVHSRVQGAVACPSLLNSSSHR